MNTKVKTYSVPVSYTGTIYGSIDCTAEQARELIKWKQFYLSDIENFQEHNLHLYTEDVIQNAIDGDSYCEVEMLTNSVVNDLVSQL